jgi:hypothetical protein
VEEQREQLLALNAQGMATRSCVVIASQEFTRSLSSTAHVGALPEFDRTYVLGLRPEAAAANFSELAFAAAVTKQQPHHYGKVEAVVEVLHEAHPECAPMELAEAAFYRAVLA